MSTYMYSVPKVKELIGSTSLTCTLSTSIDSRSSLGQLITVKNQA